MIYNFSYVEFGILFRENVLFDEQGHEVAASEVLHHEVEVLVVLEGELELNDPLVVRLGQDVPFRPDVDGLREKSTWFLSIISCLFIFLIATTWPSLALQRLTSPKAPRPMIAMNSKSFIVTFYRLLL